VRDGLPPYAKIPPFHSPGEFVAAIRFSNGQGLPFADRAPDVRGLAVKFFAADGKEMNILATNAPASFARDADQFLKVAEVLVSQQADGSLAAGEVFLKNLFAGTFNPLEAARIATALARQTALNRPSSLATQQFWGSVVQLGDYAVRMTLVPDAAALRETQGLPDADDYLRADLEARLRSGGVRYILRLRYFTDEDRTSVNDASRSWDSSPVQVDVADVVLSEADDDPAAGSEEIKRIEDAIDRMPFNPGDGFQGLAITRARKAIYEASAGGRHASPVDDYERLFRPRPS
jgi:catalase